MRIMTQINCDEGDYASEHDDYSRVYRMIMAGWGSQAIAALVALSVAEHLDSGTLTAEQIAERESVDVAMAFRLLRNCAALGLVSFNARSNTFSATPMLRVLHKDAPESLKHYAQSVTGPAFWLPAMRLTQAVRDGRNQAVEALGTNVFEYFGEHPDDARIFSSAMTDLSTPVIREAVSIIDIGKARYAVDVGGASGAFVAELVSRHRELTGSVLDLAHVVPAVAEEATRRGLADRITGIPGDFFDAVPTADIYLLKFILHDWDDDTCTKLLSNIRRSMNASARLFIVEMVVDSDAATLDAALMDLAMLFSLTGKERGIAEFEALLSQADLRAVGVAPLRGSYRLIEAAPL